MTLIKKTQYSLIDFPWPLSNPEDQVQTTTFIETYESADNWLTITDCTFWEKTQVLSAIGLMTLVFYWFGGPVMAAT